MTNRLGFFDWMIALVAPRGWIDFAIKTLVLVLLIGAMNYLRDQIQHPGNPDTFLGNTLEAAFIGLPFCTLGLALIWRLKLLQDDLLTLSATDGLTGLNNRRAFYDKANAVLPTPGGVLLMIDVDHFKQVNDRFGHAVGDQCLQSVAAHMHRFARREDIVARLGGEEFAVLLVGADADAAQDVGNRLTAGVCLPVQDANGKPSVTLSVGAVALARCTTLEDALRAADEALYVAKRNGRARMEIAQICADAAA